MNEFEGRSAPNDRRSLRYAATFCRKGAAQTYRHGEPIDEVD